MMWNDVKYINYLLIIVNVIYNDTGKIKMIKNIQC